MPQHPALREIVILDPQWILDGVSMVIRNYLDDDHAMPCDKKIKRMYPKEWTALQGAGKLSGALLELLWDDERFTAHKGELLALMRHFGLVVPVRSKADAFIVPALVALAQGGDRPPDVPDGALAATLHFSLAGSPPPELAPVWSREDLASGFLPDGAFNELCGNAVGWSYHTAKMFAPLLGNGFAHVKFGKHEVLLQRHETLPCIVATFLKAANEPSALVAAIDRLMLLVRGVGSRFVNLRCNVLLDLAGDVHQRLIDRTALLPSRLDTSQIYDVRGQQLTATQLVARLGVFLPPLLPPEHYGAFLCYSHIPAFDTPFTERLADCLGAEDPLVTTFLDIRSSQHGDLDVVCLLAQANSHVIVPVVTWNAIRRMTALRAEQHEIDYLLLEWTFALLQHKHGACVLPVFMGASDVDGTADPAADLFTCRPPMANADGSGNAIDLTTGAMIPDHRSVFERVPNVRIESVARSLERFYAKHELSPPAEIRKWTARDVVEQLSQVRGVATASSHTGAMHQLQIADEWGLHVAVADTVAKAVREAEGKAPPKLLGTTAPASPAHEGQTHTSMQRMQQELVGQRRNHGKKIQFSFKSDDALLIVQMQQHATRAGWEPLINAAGVERGWFDTQWKPNLDSAQAACVLFSTQYKANFTDALQKEATALMVRLEADSAFKIYVLTANSSDQTAVLRAWLLDDLPSQNVKAWKEFATASMGSVPLAGRSIAPTPLDGATRERDEYTRAIAAYLHARCKIPHSEASMYAQKLVHEIGCSSVEDLTEVTPEQWALIVPLPLPRKKIVDTVGASRLRAKAKPAQAGGGGAGSSSGAEVGVEQVVLSTDPPERSEPPSLGGRQKSTGTLLRNLVPASSSGSAKGGSSGLSAKLPSLKNIAASVSKRLGSSGKYDSAVEEKVIGLRQVLVAAKLRDREAEAVAWFEEQGIDSIDELRKAEMEKDLVEALKLKPGKAKVLLKDIGQYKPAAEDAP